MQGTSSGPSLPCANPTIRTGTPAAPFAMTLYDSGMTYDSGAHYDEMAALPRKKMAKIKLELQDKTEAEIIALANLHKTQITGNPNFTTPVPAAATYDPAITAAEAKLAAIGVAETGLAQMRNEKYALMNTLKSLLTQR